MNELTRNRVVNVLTDVLASAELAAKEAAKICSVIEYLQTGFFNEDASREIDRLTKINAQQAEITAWQESYTNALERQHGS